MKPAKLKGAPADLCVGSDPARKVAKFQRCRAWPTPRRPARPAGYSSERASLRAHPGNTHSRAFVSPVGIGLSRDRHLKVFLGLLIVWVAAGWCAAAPRGLPAQEGIINFGKVSEVLYRGAQPGPAEIANLKRLGVKSIINLRGDAEDGKIEAAAARANGLVYTNVPLSGIAGPKQEEVELVLGLIASLPSPVFVHCQFGCDRTGTIIACYRIRHDGWSAEAALQEANRHGLSRLELGMRRYIAAFGEAHFKAPSSKLQAPEKPQVSGPKPAGG